MSPYLQLEREQSIATITLNNPAKMNAMDFGMWQGITELLAQSLAGRKPGAGKAKPAAKKSTKAAARKRA